MLLFNYNPKMTEKSAENEFSLKLKLQKFLIFMFNVISI